MKTAQQWFDEYGESHQNKINKTIHWICVPQITVSIVGLFWSIPVPASFTEFFPEQYSFLVNFGVLFMILAFVFYLTLNRPLSIGMLIVIFLVGAIVYSLSTLHETIPLWLICVIIFVEAWIGQFIGHAIEKKKPAFFKDIQFLMIGPLWLVGHIYRQLGIRY